MSGLRGWRLGFEAFRGELWKREKGWPCWVSSLSQVQLKYEWPGLPSAIDRVRPLEPSGPRLGTTTSSCPPPTPQVEVCTFHPESNKNSDQMMSERAQTLKTLNITPHEQLFQDAVRRQNKMAELAHWLPDDWSFQPSTNHGAVARKHLMRSFESLNNSGGGGGGGATAAAGAGVGSVAGVADVRTSLPTMGKHVVDRLYAFHDRVRAAGAAPLAERGGSRPVHIMPRVRRGLRRAGTAGMCVSTSRG